MGLGGCFELLLHLLKLLGELLLGGLVELAFAEFLRELIDFLQGFVPIALLHRLGRFVGRAGARSFIFCSCSLSALSPPSC